MPHARPARRRDRRAVRRGRFGPLLARAACAGLLSACAASASAQYRFDAWTTATGLPQNSVMAIAQTRDGYLWLGTYGGLVRFDGVKFTLFDIGSHDGLRSTRIHALYEDRAGVLWIGTNRGGLARYANGTFTTYSREEGLPADTITNIYEDRGGARWLASDDGLIRFEDGRFTRYTTRDGLPANHIRGITGDRHGNVWVGTAAGLARYADGRFTTFTTRTGLPNDRIQTVRESRDGSLWVTTEDGLARLHAGRWTSYTVADGLPSRMLRGLFEDRAGLLWIPTPQGLARLDPSKLPAADTIGTRALDRALVTFTTRDGLSDNAVHAVLEDREGNIWAGTGLGGLNRLKRTQFTAFGREEGLPRDGVVPITQDRDGHLWIGMTCGGLVRYGGGIFTTFDQKDGLSNDCVWSLLAGRDRRLWIGTWGGGLTVRGTDGRFTTYRRGASGLSDDAVLSLFEDSRGVLWVGTTAGLNRFEAGRFTVYRKQDGLVDDNVRFITEDRHGALWIGTPGGLSRFAHGSFTNYTTAQGLSHNYVRAIHHAADDTVWLGTYGGGVNRLKNGRITRITAKEGLLEDVVSRILEDDSGHFWMTGNKGLFRVSRRELDAFADGAIASVSGAAYGIGDGMKSSECNGGGQPAGWKDRDGRLWFPTGRGIVAVDPRTIVHNEVPPPVLIEQVRINRTPQDFSREVRMPPRARDLEIDYTGLSFSDPEHVRFKYRLEGLHVEWTDAGTRRSAYYAHVPPGRYTFSVIAANRDGVWNTARTATVRIQVLSPFYRTWWFLTLVGIAVTAFVVAINERRVRRVRQANAAQEAFSRRLIAWQERERKRIAAALEDSLGQTLLVIKNRALLSLDAPGDRERAIEQLDEIAAAATHAIDEVRDIAYTLRPFHLDRLGLKKALDVMLEKASASTATRLTWDLDGLDGLVSKDAEIGIYRIVQEAVTNIVKHARATEASVRITTHGRGLMMTVQDNGAGFVTDASHVSPSPVSHASANDPAADAEGSSRRFGLLGLVERARLLGSEPAIVSAPGQGTTIRIVLDLATTDG